MINIWQFTILLFRSFWTEIFILSKRFKSWFYFVAIFSTMMYRVRIIKNYITMITLWHCYNKRIYHEEGMNDKVRNISVKSKCRAMLNVINNSNLIKIE